MNLKPMVIHVTIFNPNLLEFKLTLSLLAHQEDSRVLLPTVFSLRIPFHIDQHKRNWI